MPLDSKKTARIKAMGGRVTTVEEWLDITPEEVAIIDMKIRLGEVLKARRKKKRLSQDRVAKILNTSQGRVSKMEKGQASLEQLAWSLLVLGCSKQELVRAITG
ncbi:MAG: helix-turn-helix transcriptional regulator [Thermoanaerobaculia bacterium]